MASVDASVSDNVVPQAADVPADDKGVEVAAKKAKTAHAEADVVIRSAQLEDEDRLRALFVAGMRDAHLGTPEPIPELVRQYAKGNCEGDFAAIVENYVKRARSAYLVAVINGQVVGGVGLHPVEAGDEKYAGSLSEEEREATCELRRMTVDSSYRNRGVAKALLERFEEKAAELGYRTIHFTTGQLMVTAWKMYEKRGFIRKEEFVAHLEVCDYPIFRYVKAVIPK